MSVNLLQQLNTIPTPGGVGLPITTYANDMKAALTAQLTTAPQNQLNQLNAQQSAVNALQTALNQFQQATYTIASSQNWNSVTATSSNPSAFSATTASGAQASVYNIQVQSLAQYQTDILQTSPVQSSASTGANLSGSLTITPTGTGTPYKAATINVSSTDSLNTIAAAINNVTSTTGVQAQVLYNGTGYMLAVSAVQSGTINSYSLGGTLIGGTASSTQFSDTNTPAQNAQISLDGVSMTSSTNTFTQAIPNVTLNVYQTTSSTSTNTLSITSSTSATVQAVQTWMDAYNSVVDLLRKDTSFSSSTNGSGTTTTQTGPLFTDFNANSLLSQLPASVSSMTGGSGINSLAAVGIVINPSNGHLEFQKSSGYSVGSSSFTGSLQDGKTMFTQALATNPSAVQGLFGVVQNNSVSSAVPTTGVLGNVNTMLNNFLLGQGNQASAFQSDLNSIAAQQKNINDYLAQINAQIKQSVADFTSQLQQLNTAMQHSQAQMQQLSALFGGSQSSTSNSSSGTGTVG